MSGGSWDYLCYKVEDAALRLTKEKCPHRIAFGHHLLLIAKALHDIEWVDSEDKSQGEEIPSIMRVIQPVDVLKVSVEDAKEMVENLNQLIQLIEGKHE